MFICVIRAYDMKTTWQNDCAFIALARPVFHYEIYSVHHPQHGASNLSLSSVSPFTMTLPAVIGESRTAASLPGVCFILCWICRHKSQSDSCESVSLINHSMVLLEQFRSQYALNYQLGVTIYLNVWLINVSCFLQVRKPNVLDPDQEYEYPIWLFM